MRLLVAALAALALVAPADAFAHATLVRTIPANGAVVASAPRAVTVVFDDTVRSGGGNAAVANATNDSVVAGEPVAHGRTLTIPLQPKLANGAYSVRWSVVSDDGHREEGVLAFAVGAGSAAPQSVLGASVPLTWSAVLLRTLFYLGLLVAGGATVFALSARRALGGGLATPVAQLLFFALLAAFAGASGLATTSPGGTRFDLVMDVALAVALVGAAAAALAPRAPRLVSVAGAASLLLLVAPTLAGHALDRGQPRVLSALADLAHVWAASVWLGGLVALVHVVPRTASAETRRAAARRFSSTALVAVGVLGAAGLLRVATELSTVSQAWSTSYGRALLVKTAIFVVLLGVGFVNRTFLLDAFARLRRSAALEVVGIAGIVVAVAILTELRPGVDAPRASAAAAVPRAPALPPRDAVVDARELGDLAVAIAREPHRTTVTIVGPDANGVDGRTVTVDGAPTTPCGSGCYRGPAGSRVSVDGARLAFDVPARAPDARAVLARVARAYRSARTIVFVERLASSPANAETTRFTVVAPDRLAYVTRGGPQAIVVGSRRWDRDRAGARWVPSQQTPLDVTQPYWSSPTNAHEVAPGTFTFLDRSVPAWFRVTVAHGRPSVQHMTAPAHFMVDRYVGFDVPVTVSPPPSR